MMRKLVVVGCGGITGGWFKYIKSRSDIEIVGLVDIKEEAALAKKTEEQLACSTFTSLEKAISETAPDIVCDCTLPEAHHSVVTTALRTGCTVFGEKPMAATMEQAREMRDLAGERNLIYAVMQNRRYMPGIIAYRDLVQSGRIGKVGFAGCDFFIGAHFEGFRVLMVSPLILDMAIHTFDQARFITGADAVTAYCHEFNLPGSWYAGDASAICIFEMSDGSVFTYRGSWSAEGCSTPWESNWRIVGAKGTAIWESGEKPFAEVVAPETGGGFTNPPVRVDANVEYDGETGHSGCLEEMFNSLSGGQIPQTVCTDNIKSLAMVHAAMLSSRKGEKVAVEA